MDIAAAVGPQNSDRSRLVIGVAGVDPQEQSALVDLFLQMVGVVMTKNAPELRSNVPSGTPANRGRGKSGSERPGRAADGPCRDERADVDEAADEAALRVADCFARHIRRPGDFRIVRDVADLLVCVAELLLDGIRARQEAQLRAIEARAQ